MTEEEAKQKWCPYARVFMGECSANRGLPPSGKYEPCIGSACMAWRREVGLFNPKTGKFLKAGDIYPLSEDVIEAFKDEGYCGRVGKP